MLLDTIVLKTLVVLTRELGLLNSTTEVKGKRMDDFDNMDDVVVAMFVALLGRDAV